MNARLFFKTAVLIAFFPVLIAPGFHAHAVSEVAVGFVLPLSESSGDIGEQIQLGAVIAAEEINKKGGVSSLGGARLKLVFGDTRTTPGVEITETERLIQKENVAVLCGAYNSYATLLATEVAEKHKTPWVVNSSAADEITGKGFTYVFRPCNTALDDAQEQLEAVAHFSRETGKGPRTAGIVYEGSQWGFSHAENIRKLSSGKGYVLIVDKAYFAEKEDFSAHLAQIRERQPDFLILALYTDSHILFSKKLRESRIDIHFGIHSVGAGSEDPVFYASVPQQALDYLFVQEDWPVDALIRPGRAQTLARMFEKRLGRPLNAYGAQGYSNLWIIHDALERSGSVNKDKIREALAKTDITGGPALITGYQRITFNQNGQNEHAHGVVSQNQKGRRVTLWPPANRPQGATPVWPIPPWSRRQ